MKKFNDKTQTQKTRSCIGCLGVFLTFLIIISIALSLIVISFNNSHPYKGSRENLSNEEIIALDDSYKADLSEVGINVDYESIDIKKSISKIHKTKGLSKIERRALAISLGNYMSAYYIEKDQEKINTYVEEMKNEFLSGNLKMGRKDREKVLYNIYISSVIDNAIPEEESYLGLKDIDDFASDFGQANKAIYLKPKGEDYKLEQNIKQMQEIVQFIEVPEI